MLTSPYSLPYNPTTNSPIVFTFIHFWLLLTQAVSVSAVSNTNIYYNKALSNLLPFNVLYTKSGARLQMLQLGLPSTPLMEKTLTYCGSSSKDNTNWHPVCATVNNVEYMLFSKECLLHQVNRMRQHVSDTGEKKNVFRKIAMGLCRPNCSVVIRESREEPICAQNLQNDEVRFFGGHSEMALDVCLHDNEWRRISKAGCIKNSQKLDTASTITLAKEIPNKLSTPNLVKNHTSSKHTENFPKKQTKNIPRKSIPCPKVFNPVCAELFGVKATFINECLVNAENVKYGKTWKILSDGVCAEDYASSERRKNLINKRSIIDRARVTYKLNVPEVGLNVNGLWTHNNANRFYFNANAMEEKQSIQNSLLIMPNVDERVTVCKYGDGAVCGISSNNTVHHFENICELMLRNIILNEGWSVVNENKCTSENCIFNCNTSYDPYCISRNDINYTIINKCHVDYAFCRYKQCSLKILGKGECKNAVNKIDLTTNENWKVFSLNESETQSLRHVRRTLDSSVKQNEINQSIPLEKATEDSGMLPISSVTALQWFAESLTENSTTESLNTEKTTIKPNKTNKNDVTESHIMNLYRSSKENRHS